MKKMQKIVKSKFAKRMMTYTPLSSDHYQIELSEESKEIILLISYEYTNEEILKELDLTLYEIIDLKERIYTLLNVTTDHGLIRKAFEVGILSLCQTPISKEIKQI